IRGCAPPIGPTSASTALTRAHASTSVATAGGASGERRRGLPNGPTPAATRTCTSTTTSAGPQWRTRPGSGSGSVPPLDLPAEPSQGPAVPCAEQRVGHPGRQPAYRSRPQLL